MEIYWPNYYQLATILGCENKETMELVKKKILSYMEDNPNAFDRDFVCFSVHAICETEKMINEEMFSSVIVDESDLNNLNPRDLKAVIYFGINPKYQLQCLLNPRLYLSDCDFVQK